MQNRRSFIRNGAGIIAGSLVVPAFSKSLFAPSYPPPGLQMFTFFNTIDQDVDGTFKRIAEIGYVEIESAFSKKPGFYGYKPKEFADLLKGMGLKWK